MYWLLWKAHIAARSGFRSRLWLQNNHLARFVNREQSFSSLSMIYGDKSYTKEEIPETLLQIKKNLLKETSLNRIEQLSSLSKVARDSFRQKKKKSTEEEIKKRELLCLSCPFNKGNTDSLGKCEKCGCNLQVKIIPAISYCPIGKWNREVIDCSRCSKIGTS